MVSDVILMVSDVILTVSDVILMVSDVILVVSDVILVLSDVILMVKGMRSPLGQCGEAVPDQDRAVRMCRACGLNLSAAATGHRVKSPNTRATADTHLRRPHQP